jgi:hypothetical protein
MEVDVRDLSAPHCSCGAEMLVYDDLHCEWEHVGAKGSGRYVEKFRCPSCGADELGLGSQMA